MGGLLRGSLQRRCWIVPVCSSSIEIIGFLCAIWYNEKNWLATGCMGCIDRMVWGWDWGGVGVLTLADAVSIAPPFSLEVRRATGSGGRRREAVASTNCINSARARNICVRAAE